MPYTKITPVLLAGGSGSRLWPVSRKSYPKQFSKILGKHSLFQSTALRLISSGSVIFNSHLTVTNSDFRFLIGEQLLGVGIDPGPILIEPEGKNTAPAVLAASLYAYNRDKSAVLLVAPSDHNIANNNYFHSLLLAGISEVEKGKFVSFGIRPSRIETGYGYMKVKKNPSENSFDVTQFVEKPNHALAEKMFKDGNFLWNSGIYMFEAKKMIEAFKVYAPDLLLSIEGAIQHGQVDLGFFRLDPSEWNNCQNISIDYAIMEKTSDLVALPFDKKWSDLGTWDAVWEEMKKDKNQVAISSNATALKCENTLLRSESTNLHLVGLGLKNIVAVAMEDAVLVSHKDKVQEVKELVGELKSLNVKQADTYPIDYRPWGWFETLRKSDRFQVKLIVVNPGLALSLQSHHHRSEHWIVVKGTAEVTINEKITLVTEGESVYIPLGAKHRLANPGKLPMLLIEVQTGSYLGEDDIMRYKDDFNRST